MTSSNDSSDLYPYTPPPPPPAATPLAGGRDKARRSKLTRTAAGLAVVLGAGAGAAAVAQAATSSTSSSTTTTTSPTTATPTRPCGPMHGFGFGFGGFGRGMLGPMGAVHAQFTVPAASGGYETIATQVGTVQSVSSSSISVKSADGYTQAYVVNSSTVVNADSEGIGSVNKGDTVTVEATVSGSTYTAQQVTDTTQVQANRQSWAPRGPGSPTTTTPAA